MVKVETPGLYCKCVIVRPSQRGMQPHSSIWNISCAWRWLRLFTEMDYRDLQYIPRFVLREHNISRSVVIPHWLVSTPEGGQVRALYHWIDNSGDCPGLCSSPLHSRLHPFTRQQIYRTWTVYQRDWRVVIIPVCTYIMGVGKWGIIRTHPLVTNLLVQYLWSSLFTS